MLPKDTDLIASIITGVFPMSEGFSSGFSEDGRLLGSGFSFSLKTSSGYLVDRLHHERCVLWE